MTSEVNQFERAFHMWNELVMLASQKNSVTYKQLAQRLGLHHRVLRYPLELIQNHCLEAHLPALTVLVVNSYTGKPGAGFTAHSDIKAGTREVLDYPWGEVDNPFVFASEGKHYEELVRRVLKSSASAEEVYALVKTRGTMQRIFRDALLLAYRGCCAFSGSTILEALEAAHIVPWSEATDQERFDIRNGLLLNAFYHRLFDNHLLVLGTDYRIAAGSALNLKTLGDFDRQAIEPLLGQQFKRPHHRDYFPNKEYLARKAAPLEI